MYQTIMDYLTFTKENRERILAVENSFSPGGTALAKPGRILVGEGRLLKQGRKKPQLKAFFLFSDVLVYGSVLLCGRWHRKQRVIPLEDILLEDMEDGVRLTNQWLIRTPRKSFFVSAPTQEEKQAWMQHIEDCRSNLRPGPFQGDGPKPVSHFAVSWIPDKVSSLCMRCTKTFTVTKRRHHCRQCGFIVCNACSKDRTQISHINTKKKLRVCSYCYSMKNEENEVVTRQRGGSTDTKSSEEDDLALSSDEEEMDETMMDNTPSKWLDSHSGTWGQMGTYVSVK
ncbi:pleckstrin homology domain-containing family F member 2-like [Sphaeramia orbicularis]|uniref:Pleckstrin homology domain-containing family F member 2-like n=1 Tax=Sphaeramia orbicularis TaxID=375764 RepID=A0A672YID0_9TELE|nr:pleckstrin homology domain-containing family F member 2-like [Sphaeramia orbicularis]